MTQIDMKREIKFRGRTYDGKWVFGSLSSLNAGKYILVQSPTNDEDIENYPVHSETVGQFTGKYIPGYHPMFDGKTPIWEDDIFTVGTSKTEFRVVFEHFEWIGISDEGDDWGKYKERLSTIKGKLNIIGNIHDKIKKS